MEGGTCDGRIGPADGARAPLSARLDALQETVPEIAAASYLDLDAGLVLGTSSLPGLPQEALDDLCRAAVRALDGAEVDQALLAGALGVAVFQRLPGRAGAALCLLLDPEMPPASAREVAAGAVQAMTA
jgi:hypothetical protein